MLLPETWIVVRIDGRGFSKYVPSVLVFYSSSCRMATLSSLESLGAVCSCPFM